MTENTKKKILHIVTRIRSQIGQLYGNMAYDDDDEGVDDEIIFDVATLILRDANAALELCNIKDSTQDVTIPSRGSKIEKMRLAVDRIWDNSDDLRDELNADSDLDVDVIVHILNSIVRDTNILLNFLNLNPQTKP